MAKLLFLTDRERDLMQEFLDRVRGDRVNTPSRPQQERSYSEAEDHQAPETYIALAPVEGLPALTAVALTGTGTVDEDEIGTPGFAECDIYKIVSGSIVDAGFTKTIYNLSPRDIPREIEIETCPEKTMVTSVCFDDVDCVLTVCDVVACFPLGTKFQPEDCGEAGTGTGPCDETDTGTVGDDLVLNFFLTHRDKFGTWLVGAPILNCEVPGTGTDGCP